MNVYKEKTIGEWVAEDYRAAAVFKSFGIDFCCKGGRSIQEACEAKNITERDVEIALAETVMDKPNQGDINFKSWPMDLLADYIEKTHHRYVEKATEELKPYLDKICKVHGVSNPELHEIKSLFFESAGELTAHMKKEEFILFPYVRNLQRYVNDGGTVEVPHFGTVKNPIKMMMEEHVAEGDRFEEIARLTNNYTPPEHACNTYRVTFALLEEFQNDLHRHIHLENNILFPKAVELEESLNVLS
jgi:regulator of cell morphogenesis and NO signaling